MTSLNFLHRTPISICCLLIFFAFLVTSCSQADSSSMTLFSNLESDYAFTIEISNKKELFYSVDYKGKEIIGHSTLGFQFSEGIQASKNISMGALDSKEVRSKWKPVYGEKNSYPDIYSEDLIVLEGDALFNIRVRTYKEGIAFRYEFHRPDTLTITKELTEFNLTEKATAWASERAQSEINKMPITAIEKAVERPLLVELPDSLFVAIGEAALVDFSRMKLSAKPGKPGTLVADLDDELIDELPLHTPWRFIMAAESPGEILENNYFLLNLNEPNKIEDVSWIKPGKVIRETTLTTRGGMACVDFAAKHKLEYIEFDAGWYGNEYDDSSDATTITVDPKRSKGPLDLLKVIAYAKSKDIGVILYVNRRALEKQLNEVLPLLQSWGVSGVKYGFVNVGPQKWTSWLHDAVRKAADHQLMIDVHDEYRPTGYSRTYPNFMTQEGIRGDEESPDNAMVINTIFTRMIAGAGDQTNCYFAPRVTEKMGSHVSQLAKAVCIYSPWQFLYWYDRPEGSVAGALGAGGTTDFIQEVPELAFYDALPTVWDDTKVLGGYPGEYAIIARQSGNDWFIGALSGDTTKQVDISLDFLAKGQMFEATIYSDDPGSTAITKVKIEKRKVSAADMISHSLLKKNGLAIHLKAL